MNTQVDFTTAKLLKEKGFAEKTNGAYVDTTPFSESKNDFVEYSVAQNHNEKEHRVSAPTIAEVVMWLYENHEIWIAITIISHESWQCYLTKIGESLGLNYNINSNSPTEAYSQAIEYTLKNLI